MTMAEGRLDCSGLPVGREVARSRRPVKARSRARSKVRVRRRGARKAPLLVALTFVDEELDRRVVCVRQHAVHVEVGVVVAKGIRHADGDRLQADHDTCTGM